MNILTKQCKTCGKDYYKRKSMTRKMWETVSKYCSWQCQRKGLIGHIAWNKGKKMGFTPVHAYKKGHIPWHKGKKGLVQNGESHPMWKGNKAGYSSKHKWIVRWKGKPKKCEQCGTTKAKKYEWANIDHKYNRILNDYIRMCTSCHRKYDNQHKV